MIKMRKILGVGLPSLLLFFPGVSIAEAPAKPAAPSLRVSGEAVLSVKPDRAEATLGVVTRGATAKAAGDENARRASELSAELRKAAGAKAEFKTAGYNLYPVYEHKGGRAPKPVAYEARNMVTVTLDDLDRVGPVLDAAIRAGADEVRQVSFTLKDREAAERQALKTATERARAKADAAAAALGATVLRVLLLEEGGAGLVEPPQPMFRAMAMEASAMHDTPVEPGSIEVRASVALTVEISVSK